MNNKEPVNQLIGGGLKCDNPECDYKDMTIPINDYKKWINAPCPKCGANLLTKKDYRMLKILQGIIKVCNFICFFIPKKKLGETIHAKIEFDGTGKPIIGPIEPYIDVNDIMNKAKDVK